MHICIFVYELNICIWIRNTLSGTTNMVQKDFEICLKKILEHNGVLWKQKVNK